MNETPAPDDPAARKAAADLARLNERVQAMQAVLVRLLQDVVVAEKHLESSQASQMLEANEQLVVSAMRNQADAESASQALDLMAQSAELDPLTGLPNRLLLLDRLQGAMAHAKRNGTSLALLFLDLDKFKEINDSFGHLIGDEALRQVANCLESSVRAVDTVSRYGGDEFLVLLSDVSQPSDAMLVADKMLALIDVPAHIGDHVVQLSASIGISLYPEDGKDAGTLIERADAAMYRAKRRGAGSRAFHGETVFDPPLPAASDGVARPVAAHIGHPLDPASRNAQLQEANEQLVLAALSAQELQDAMLEARRRQTEFLTIVANELRDPLAPIRLAAAQLGRDPTDAALLPRAQAIIARQAAHMERLVDDLLDMLHGNAGRLRFKREQLDLNTVITEAIHAAQPGMQERRQSFALHLPPTPLAVHGHAAHLLQIIGNLLDNASKYTPDCGEINLGVAEEGGQVVITVSDNGVGITEDALLRVFDPFVQDTHAIGFNGVGAGIGLTVVRELVEAHGGSVVASSGGRGLGSRFAVTLPTSAAPRAGRDAAA